MKKAACNKCNYYYGHTQNRETIFCSLGGEITPKSRADQDCKDYDDTFYNQIKESDK